MKYKRIITVLLILLAAAVVAGGYMVYDRTHQEGDALPGKVLTNASYIDGLYSNFDLTDTLAVFRYIFSRLDDEVTVYPSEGYCYFQFMLRGKVLHGALMFFTPLADSGIIDFGYIVRVEDKIKQPRVPQWGGYRRFRRGDGLEVTKIDNFTFRLTFEGKSVLFRLYHDEPHPPHEARLTADEVPVGPSFDESGLRFYLIYNRSTRWVYWILNEDGFVPEDFNKMNGLVVMGQRTGFVFYLDTLNNRKILVAVDGYNVLSNNWFDGPFDQMPDRLVYNGETTVKPYLDSAFRLEPDRIDRYGNFRRSSTSRVPVSPYSVYYRYRDLRFIDSITALNLPPSRLYTALTRIRIPDPPADD